MADKGEEEEESGFQSSLSSWWGSFYDTAKQKLNETNEFLVRDIKEFTTTVKNDTSKLVADTAASMKDQLNIKVNLDEASHATKVVTNSISGFLGKVVQQVTPIPPDDSDNEDSTMYLGTSSGVKVMSPAEARLFNLRTSPATYCNEPDNMIEFEVWLESFKLDEKKEELSLLMLDSKEVRSLYTKLVPEAVSHVDFWTRYFYKKHELEKAERRRALLVERAQSRESELVWDDDDDVDHVADPHSGSIEKDAAMDSPSTSRDVVAANADTNDTTTEEANTDLSDNTNSNAANSNEHTEDNDGVVKTSDTPLQTVEVHFVPDIVENVTADAIPKQQVEVVGAVDETGDQNDSSPAVLKVEENDTSNVDDGNKPIETTTASKESTVSVKAVESSSGNSSDSWEKDFDLDMTEDEINQALQEEDKDDADIEGWEEWE